MKWRDKIHPKRNTERNKSLVVYRITGKSTEFTACKFTTNNTLITTITIIAEAVANAQCKNNTNSSLSSYHDYCKSRTSNSEHSSRGVRIIEDITPLYWNVQNSHLVIEKSIFKNSCGNSTAAYRDDFTAIKIRSTTTIRISDKFETDKRTIR